MKYLNKFIIINVGLSLFFLLLFLTVPVYSEVRTQFVPSLSISEKYTDNYNQTDTNKVDEFSTIYSADFSFGVIDKNASMFFSYQPAYNDFASHDEDDSWSHTVSLNGQSQISKHTNLTFSENFARDLSRTIRTNSLEKHDNNTTSIGIRNEFGTKDSVGLNYEYSFDSYENPNADDYSSHNPSAFFSYWFTSQFGMDLNASYKKTKYDISVDEPETWFGDIKLLRSMTPHLDTYISYAYTLTDQASGDHTINNPSVGFDWRPTDDSGISMGVGILFQEWQNYSNSQDLFIDLDVYKNFDFSRKCTLSVTGSSGYTATSEEAASLGFEIYYQAGALLSYRLTRRLTSELSSSYRRSQFDDPVLNRQDDTLNLGGSLIWSPLQWMTMNLSYSFTDFNTNSVLREDYKENVGTFTISFTPPQPVRFNSSNSRRDLENRLFE